MYAFGASPLEPARDFGIIRDYYYDVFITDIGEADFAKLTFELGVERLSVAEKPPEFPVRGIW